MKAPAKNPCGSCPYRRDVPSGVWDESEYHKLPEFDKPTAEQPPRVFMCHQDNDRLCAGWVACHDMDESLGFRINAFSLDFCLALGRLLRGVARVVCLTTPVDDVTRAAAAGEGVEITDPAMAVARECV